MAKKNSLGRGLDSLFSENNEPSGSTVSVLRVSDIEPNPKQPRKKFDDAALAELSDSIARHGLLQPIAVRETDTGYYQIIAGERRWRAAKLAGMTEMPAIIYEMDDKKAAELALIENLQREDLNPVEEAVAFRALIDQYGLTQEDAAQQVGKSRSAVANTLRLLDLPEQILEKVSDGTLSAGHARALLSLRDTEDVFSLAERIAARSLTVRQAEAEAKALNEERAKKGAARSALKEEFGRDEHGPIMLSRYFYKDCATNGDARSFVSYMKKMEQRASKQLGRRFRVLEAGNDKKHRRVEILVESNEDIEFILRRLCGTDFFDRTDD